LFGLQRRLRSVSKLTIDLIVPVWYVDEVHGAVIRNDAADLQLEKSMLKVALADPFAAMSPSCRGRLLDGVTAGVHGMPKSWSSLNPVICVA
jgi:hypothetical protein